MGDYGVRFGTAVAAELRAERARGQLTIGDLVNATPLSKSAVLNYLNGHRDIPMPAFVELCEALSVSPRVIFERAEKAAE